MHSLYTVSALPCYQSRAMTICNRFFPFSLFSQETWQLLAHAAVCQNLWLGSWEQSQAMLSFCVYLQMDTAQLGSKPTQVPP